MQNGHHLISLSLGGAVGPTGLAVIEPRSEYWHPKGNESELDYQNHYTVFWLERFDPGRPSSDIAARVRAIAAERRLARGYDVLVDITKTGSAAVRSLEDLGLRYVQPVEITNAADATYHNGIERVPFLDVGGTVKVVLQDDRIKVSSELALAATLLTDLQVLDPAMPRRASEAGQSDDLMIAVAVAIWWGERLQWNEEVAASMLPENDDDYYDETDRSPVTGY